MWRSTVVLACVLLAGCDVGGADEAETAAREPDPPTLAPGEERDFGAGVLEPGDVVRCRAGGLVAEAVVEAPRSRVSKQTTHAWLKDGSSASLSLDVRPTGRVIAVCST